MAKKTSSVKKSYSGIVALDPQHFFYAYDGTVLKNLNELATFLTNVDENAFRHHVHERDGAQWNDFGNWVRDIIKDKTLARTITKAKSVETMRKAVEKKLV